MADRIRLKVDPTPIGTRSWKLRDSAVFDNLLQSSPIDADGVDRAAYLSSFNASGNVLGCEVPVPTSRRVKQSDVKILGSRQVRDQTLCGDRNDESLRKNAEHDGLHDLCPRLALHC